MNSDTFELWVLWYNGISGFPLHWSLFVCVAGSNKGNRHDVVSAETSGRPRFTRRYKENYDKTQSSNVLGSLKLHDLPDPAAFEEIVTSRAMPLLDRNENCQTWIWNVVRKAVGDGKLDAAALTQLGQARVLG
jgi:hypothetical protein